MLSRYEILYVFLADQYTLSRKIIALNRLSTQYPSEKAKIDAVKAELLGDLTEAEALERFESEDRNQHIEYHARRVAADLLTLGKLQPEHMLAFSGLPEQDYQECVKRATLLSAGINAMTQEAERALNTNSIPSELV